MNKTTILSTIFSISSLSILPILAEPSTPEIQITNSKESKSKSRMLAEEFGSLTNAKVALKLTAPDQKLVYFTKFVAEEELAELKRIAPNLTVVTGLSKKEALARAEEAHGVDTTYASEEFLKKATNLAWVQARSAGVDRYLKNEVLMNSDQITFSNQRAIHGPAIAEHSMAMLLSLTRNLRYYSDKQHAEEWMRRSREPDPTLNKPIALQGKTMFVVGLGGIGSEIAERANAFGMRVIGTRRSDKPSADYIEKVGKPDDLLKMLPEADVVALAVPLTKETKGLINTEALKVMKKGSYLINIARGEVVDTEALIEALNSKQLAGAGLDVTSPEPLPKGHPLWSTPNVVITPHMASNSVVTDTRRSALFRENLRRFASGEPLLNVVNKELGY